MTLDEPEYEVVGLTLKQRIALWRIILREKVRCVLGLPVVRVDLPVAEKRDEGR